jgi:hypothetical protein
MTDQPEPFWVAELPDDGTIPADTTVLVGTRARIHQDGGRHTMLALDLISVSMEAHDRWCAAGHPPDGTPGCLREADTITRTILMAPSAGPLVSSQLMQVGLACQLGFVIIAEPPMDDDEGGRRGD